MPKPLRSLSVSNDETVLCVSVSIRDYYDAIPVVAFVRFCAFLIIPGIRSHQAVTSIGGDSGNSFSRIEGGFALRSRAL
jgi:hypothetical protein